MKKMLLILVMLLFYLLFYLSKFYFYIPIPVDKIYYSSDFQIEVIKSNVDKDNDGIDDFSDILEGAKITVKNHVEYKSAYYGGGYPPDDEGVCTDVIWRSLLNAGYNLKEMIDYDIANNTSLYPRTNGYPDPNIDFRRVPNLKVFFERKLLNLTTDLNKIKEWMPGDIVIFDEVHVGIVSNIRNARGIPYLIHNSDQPFREEDILQKRSMKDKITGHYRFILKN